MRCWGELKSLRAQSVGEVSAYQSCVQYSGCVEMKVSQAYTAPLSTKGPKTLFERYHLLSGYSPKD